MQATYLASIIGSDNFSNVFIFDQVVSTPSAI